MHRILLVEDDARLAKMVADYLSEAGFRVTHAPTGAEAENRLRRESFDALVLDLMLPDTDGLDVCRRIRAESSIPVLMLTARGDPLDRVVGLELGADDYVAKPFHFEEIHARLLALLRRSGGWRSTRGRAKCGSTASRARSPGTSSRCCWRWRSGRAACCRARH